MDTLDGQCTTPGMKKHTTRQWQRVGVQVLWWLAWHEGNKAE